MKKVEYLGVPKSSFEERKSDFFEVFNMDIPEGARIEIKDTPEKIFFIYEYLTEKKENKKLRTLHPYKQGEPIENEKKYVGSVLLNSELIFFYE